MSQPSAPQLVPCAVWWIRRDLRLADNTALDAALRSAQRVMPVFVLEDRLLAAPRLNGPRIAWLLEALHEFDARLRAVGARLTVRRGDPVTCLDTLCRESGAQAVFFNRDYSPYAVRRDSRVQTALEAAGIAAYAFKDLILHEPAEIPTRSGRPYEVYTPFRKAWEVLPKPPVIPAPDVEKLVRLALAERPAHPVASDSIPMARELGVEPVSAPIVPPGEAAAQDRLAAFVAGPILAYKNGRDLLAGQTTSILSPYLRWGMISPRTAYHAAAARLRITQEPTARAGVETWISELVWREFNYAILIDHPHIVRGSFRPVYDAIRWENDSTLLEAWQRGETGYPVVDAAMRQLRRTGWMHNRARMIAASFLCKDLLIDWRLGEAHFMRYLLDGDLASNIGGWQWTAGTGTDAAPYFRIFNPTAQSEKFDPEGDYIRQYVPALRHVPVPYIHAPHTMPPLFQAEYGCVIGRDYPAPVVTHAAQRERALALYSAARASFPHGAEG